MVVIWIRYFFTSARDNVADFGFYTMLVVRHVTEFFNEIVDIIRNSTALGVKSTNNLLNFVLGRKCKFSRFELLRRRM